MKTQEVKEYYDVALGGSNTPYEEARWFSTPQARAGYAATKSALKRHALTHLKDGMRVFELGPGPGTWTKELLAHAPDATYNLVDISEEMLEQARASLQEFSNVSFTQSDILDYTADAPYDFFFSSRMIEYIPVADKDEAVKGITSNLKSGAHGYIVTKMPQYNRFYRTKSPSDFHKQQITPEELASLFTKHGCTVMKKIHVTCVFPKAKSGLLDRITTAICRMLPFSFGASVSESYALVFKKQ